MKRQIPLIVILGATACGKSKLAIELALKFNGEIISADSMQVYKGLDIVTNKVTKEERAQVKHHMIDCIEPSQRFSIVDFRNRSIDIILKSFKKNILPVIVGGTNYYIESLLWRNFLLEPSLESHRMVPANDESTNAEQSSPTKTLIDSEMDLIRTLPAEFLHNEEDLEDLDRFFSKTIYHESFKEISSDKLWNLLEKVDPKASNLYHPNDKRKIIRSLQIIQQQKRNYSDILEDINKSNEVGKASLGGPLRFEPTCVIWLSCDNEILDKVLDERVDIMLERGLLSELENFHRLFTEPDYTKGIFQTIGLKEFHQYLILDEAAKKSPEGIALLAKSISEMKISTRRYARRQLKWIRQRFLRKETRDLPPLYKLTTTFKEASLDEDLWEKQVKAPAFEIVERILSGNPLPAGSFPE